MHAVCPTAIAPTLVVPAPHLNSVRDDDNFCRDNIHLQLPPPLSQLQFTPTSSSTHPHGNQACRSLLGIGTDGAPFGARVYTDHPEHEYGKGVLCCLSLALPLSQVYSCEEGARRSLEIYVSDNFIRSLYILHRLWNQLCTFLPITSPPPHKACLWYGIRTVTPLTINHDREIINIVWAIFPGYLRHITREMSWNCVNMHIVHCVLVSARLISLLYDHVDLPVVMTQAYLTCDYQVLYPQPCDQPVVYIGHWRWDHGHHQTKYVTKASM